MITEKRIKEIKRRYKDVFDILEDYDKTHALPFQRKRINISLSNKTIKRLNDLSKKQNRPISHLIEEKFA